MHPVIYDVAVSIDGYISGPDGDISGFAHTGAVVDDYVERLQSYTCALMGRATYEFGYHFGLEPGQNPYPHMQSYVFSSQTNVPQESAVTFVSTALVPFVQDLKHTAPGPIYLCGGGALGGALLSAGLIDTLRLKRAPLLLGGGTPLFAQSALAAPLTLSQEKSFPGGYVYQEYNIDKSNPE